MFIYAGLTAGERKELWIVFFFGVLFFRNPNYSWRFKLATVIMGSKFLNLLKDEEKILGWEAECSLPDDKRKDAADRFAQKGLRNIKTICELPRPIKGRSFAA